MTSLASADVMPRRKGNEWFVGAIAPSGEKISLPLAFLAPGKPFTASLHYDLPNGGGLRVEQRVVDSATVLDAAIPANGGLAVRLVP